MAECAEIRALARAVGRSSSVSLRDLLDHVCWESNGQTDAIQVEGARWTDARSLLERGACQKLEFACRVESVDDFVRAHDLSADEGVGAPFGPFRKRLVLDLPTMCLSLVERSGHRGFSAPPFKEREVTRARIHKQVFRTRQRDFRTDAAGLATLSRLVMAAETELGRDWTAALFLQAELEFWMSRCGAGRFQHARQIKAGVGWGSLRWLAYASSREAIHSSVALFELMGFSRVNADRLTDTATLTLRPQPGLGLPEIIFAVDSNSDEQLFAGGAQAPSPLTSIGPAGLWCALYGQSLLTAGPIAVHAACRSGDHLLGAEADLEFGAQHQYHDFTPVDPKRVRALEEQEFITSTLAENLRLNGSAGPRLFVQPPPLSDIFQHERICINADARLRSAAALPRVRRRRRRRSRTSAPPNTLIQRS